MSLSPLVKGLKRNTLGGTEKAVGTPPRWQASAVLCAKAVCPHQDFSREVTAEKGGEGMPRGEEK